MIGILTFHRASNYGAILQAYALFTAIKKSGKDVEIIDYRSKIVERAHNPRYVLQNIFANRLSRILKLVILKGLKSIPNKKRKYAVFKKFRDRYFTLSATVDSSSIENLVHDYDRIIVGSDQVWSLRFAGGDPVYFLSMGGSFKRYSYAASFGFDEFPNNFQNECIDGLRLFDRISVRESSAVTMLQKCGFNSRVDVDPVFLLSREEWSDLAVKPKEEHYILVYTVPPPEKLLDYARKLSQKTGCKLIYLNNEHRANRDIKHVRFTTPEEFLGWIEHADYVLTNSFHGTAFSIIFRRNFKVELNTNRGFNVRSHDLITRCSLKNAVMNEEFEEFNFQHGWESALVKLDQMIQESKDYIKSII